jgi:hypothetical protein
MSPRIACRVENLEARSDRRDTLEDLVYKMFERRHHSFVAGTEQDWLTVELVQSLRRESEVYREKLSTETSGPLPFALGYFQLHDETLKLTTEQIPANVDPEVFTRFLSEFVKPGGRIWVGTPPNEQGWEICGIDELSELTSPAASGE